MLPLSSLDSLRVVLASLVIENLSLLTDVSTAFMHAPVETDGCDLVLLGGNT